MGLFGYRIVRQEYLDALKAGALVEEDAVEKLEAELDRTKAVLKAREDALKEIYRRAHTATVDMGIEAAQQGGRFGVGVSKNVVSTNLPRNVVLPLRDSVKNG